MTGAVYARTKNLGLGLIEFNFPNWSDDENNNMKILDAAMSVIGVSVKGSWENNTPYNRGDLVVDTDTNTLWRANVDNTSAASGTFAEDRAANPTYWADASGVLHARGMWTTATTYYVNDVVYKDVNKYSWAMVTVQYESAGSYDADVAAGNLVIITDSSQVVSDANAAKTAAQNSATSAATSASTATTQATNASNSATAAAGSATAASSSASSATASASAASTSATNAATSATNASNSATAAAGSASSASSSAASAAASLAAMLPDAPADGTFYSRKDHTWQMTPGTMADAPSDGNTYARKNAAWVPVVGGAIIGDNAPAGPAQGQMWWDSSSGSLYIYYNDGTSSQWVQVN